jgi:hypothetical protein
MVLYLWLRLDELPDDGIVSGGHRVEDPVNPLQRLLVLHVHSTIARECHFEFSSVVQFCGSGIFIPDPDFCPSQVPDRGPRIQKNINKREVISFLN